MAPYLPKISYISSGVILKGKLLCWYHRRKREDAGVISLKLKQVAKELRGMKAVSMRASLLCLPDKKCPVDFGRQASLLHEKWDGKKTVLVVAGCPWVLQRHAFVPAILPSQRIHTFVLLFIVFLSLSGGGWWK